MKVWLVIESFVYPETRMYGIYSTEERAEAVRAELLEEEDRPNHYVWVNSMDVED